MQHMSKPSDPAPALRKLEAALAGAAERDLTWSEVEYNQAVMDIRLLRTEGTPIKPTPYGEVMWDAICEALKPGRPPGDPDARRVAVKVYMDPEVKAAAQEKADGSLSSFVELAVKERLGSTG